MVDVACWLEEQDVNRTICEKNPYTVKAPGTEKRTTFLSFQSSVEMVVARSLLRVYLGSAGTTYEHHRQAKSAESVGSMVTVLSDQDTDIALKLGSVWDILECAFWDLIADLNSRCHNEQQGMKASLNGLTNLRSRHSDSYHLILSHGFARYHHLLNLVLNGETTR